MKQVIKGTGTSLIKLRKLLRKTTTVRNLITLKVILNSLGN